MFEKFPKLAMINDVLYFYKNLRLFWTTLVAVAFLPMQLSTAYLAHRLEKIPNLAMITNLQYFFYEFLTFLDHPTRSWMVRVPTYVENCMFTEPIDSVWKKFQSWLWSPICSIFFTKFSSFLDHPTRSWVVRASNNVKKLHIYLSHRQYLKNFQS